MKRMHSGFLLSILMVVGCTAIAALPLSSAAPTTGEFTPCNGPGTPPPGAEGSTGPWAGRLMIAYSEDGLAWTRANRVLTDQAGVPDAILDDDGTVRVYYVTWCPQEVHNRTVVALSDDAGQTWSYRQVTINGLDAGQPSAVDPDIVRTDDGRWRLYFTSAPATPGATPRTYSAISDDGFTFELEAGYRLYVEGREVLDPSVIRIGDVWHLFAGGAVGTPGYNWHATSTDGLTFTPQDDFGIAGLTMANGLAVEGGYRFYGFRPSGQVVLSSPGQVVESPTDQATNRPHDQATSRPTDQPPTPQPRPTEIKSVFTADGVAWTEDSGVRLAPDASATLEALGVKDPAVARLPDGRYVMVYVTTIPEYLESGGGSSAWTKEEGTRVQGGIPYIVSLDEGGFRLYFCRPGGIYSAVSTDGLTFTEEPGVRISGGCDPSLVTLDDGTYRMYYKVQVDEDTHVVHSATSADGLIWTLEGLRFQNVDSPCYGWTSVPDAVRLPDGRVRLYFVCDKGRGAIASAVSDDGLSFTLEDGLRLERAVDPNVLRLADGSYWMFYATSPEGQRVVPPQQIYTARSTDGLNWTVEGEVLSVGGPYDSHAVADPSAIEFAPGRYRVYYGGDGYVLSAISGTSTPSPTPTPTPTPPPASQCVGDTNANGVGDVADIIATAMDLPCHVYLPVVAANWRQPWPSATPTPTPTPTTPAPAVEQLPINVVYVNHVEVESVLDYNRPLVDGTTYATTSEKYADTSAKLEWEMAQAEAVGASVSFHMSGAYAERAVDAGAKAVWAGRLADGHTVGVHFHSFLRGPQPFQWTYSPSPDQVQIAQAWEDNHDLVADLVGADALWIGESHYACPSCWQDLGYQLRTTEQMAQLPAGQHIVWLVERDRSGVITYPHFPQIGQAAWHGPAQHRNYFDLRVPQLKKEFLMLYLEWLERERLGLESQVWAWGWVNHGGRNTERYAGDIQEMLTWLSDNFAGRTSPRGNVIAEFVSDHQLADRYKAYEQAGGQPLPSPTNNVNDQFSYLAYALEDTGVTADLSAELGLAGVRLFELERNPAENPPPGAPPKVYLLFRETDGSGEVDISAVLASRGVDPANLTLINVVDGSAGPANGSHLLLASVPLVLEAGDGPGIVHDRFAQR